MRVPKADPPGPDAARAAGFGACAASAQAQGATQKKSASSKSRNSSHRAKSSKKSQRRERGQKAPTPDRNFRDSAGARERRFVHWKTEREMGRRDNGSDEKVPGSAWAKSPTGKLDAKTLQQLGLGSHTAGVAPPMPPMSSFFSAENDTL